MAATALALTTGPAAAQNVVHNPYFGLDTPVTTVTLSPGVTLLGNQTFDFVANFVVFHWELQVAQDTWTNISLTGIDGLPPIDLQMALYSTGPAPIAGPTPPGLIPVGLGPVWLEAGTYDLNVMGYGSIPGSFAFTYGLAVTGLPEPETPGNLQISSLPLGPSTPPVPEPSEWAMMLAGLAMLGMVARRRAQRG